MSFPPSGFRQTKADEAERYLEAAIAINAGSTMAYCELGFLQYGLGKPVAAIETVKKAIGMEPGLKESHFYLARGAGFAVTGFVPCCWNNCCQFILLPVKRTETNSGSDAFDLKQATKKMRR